jgi:hypothetical protein
MERVVATGCSIAVHVVAIRGWGICPSGVKQGDLFRSDREVGAVCR